MAKSLRQYAELIALRLNQPFNEILIQSLKTSIKYYRALFLRQDIEKNGDSNMYYQHYIDNLIKVDEVDDCEIESGCTILRTKNPVPRPVRVKTTEPFRYVGKVNRKSIFGLMEAHLIPFNEHNKYTAQINRYDYRNNYIYAYLHGADKLIKHILIDGIFMNPDEIVNRCANAVDCFEDVDDLYMGDDLLPRIISGIMQGELQMITDSKEIRNEKPDIQQQVDHD